MINYNETENHNGPKPTNGNQYTKYSSLGKIMSISNKQHLTNV